MSDELTNSTPSAPTPAATPTPSATPTPTTETVTTSPTSIQDAGKQFLASLGESEEVTTPGELSWDALAQRFRAPNGEFASTQQVADSGDNDPEEVGEGVADPQAPTATEGEEAAGEDGDEEAEPTVEEAAVRVTLPGDTQRDEEDLDIEVTDPAIAERLARLKNDGMRRNEFQRRIGEVATRESKLKEVEVSMATNPVGFMLDRITPARQIEVARALMAQHFEALAPDIEKFWYDESERKLALADIKESTIEARRTTESEVQYQAQIQQVIQTVQGLIPDTANDADAEEFLRDSLLHLEALSRERKAVVNPAEVPTLLTSRLTRYGFPKTGTPAPAKTAPSVTPVAPSPAAPRVAVARPVGEDAKAIADRAKAAQQRQKIVRAQRANAAAVAPAGAGAMPVERPKPPKGADVKAASAWVRDKLTSNGWGAPS